MADRISFFVAGEPAPRAAPSAFWKPGMTRAGIYRKTRPWERHASLVCQEHRCEPLISGPVRVELEFIMPRVSSLPKRKEKPHVVKPDLDNMVKAMLDAMQQIIFVRDEAVVALQASKRYAREGEGPGVLVSVTELGEGLEEAK